jgi:hypothetical protein
MQTGEAWDLRKLSDNELLQGLLLLVKNERRSKARVVAHLAEVEERRLHLRAGCSSLFDYCLSRLAMSGGEAFRRVNAARLARRFPVIVDLLVAGDIHLCALLVLRDYLTQANHRELLAQASRKTKLQVQELVARLSPRPDVPSMLRRLPAPVSISQERLVAPSQENGVVEDKPAALPSGPAAPALVLRPPPPPIEPLREDRYRLQLNASAELKRKLELARDLMSHSNPNGDLAVVVERALDALIDKLERERFAKVKRPRSDARPQPDKRRVSNAVRREVVARDGLQCSYVSPNGRRCPSRAFLQLHHEHAWALGGATDAANVRILCLAHNQMLAEQDFGKEKIASAVAASRALPES